MHMCCVFISRFHPSDFLDITDRPVADDFCTTLLGVFMITMHNNYNYRLANLHMYMLQGQGGSALSVGF